MTALCQGTLAPAVLPGGRIDAAHPAAVAYALERGLDPGGLLDSGHQTRPRATEKTTTTAAVKPSGAVLPPLADPSEVTNVLDLTLRQVTDKHGSQQGLADWLDLRKTAAEIVRIEMANLEKAGTLIERQRVVTHVIGYVDGAQKRLLSDVPKTIAARLFALARGDGTLEEGERAARDTISSILRPAREQAVRALRRKRRKEPDAPTTSDR